MSSTIRLILRKSGHARYICFQYACQAIVELKVNIGAQAIVMFVTSQVGRAAPLKS